MASESENLNLTDIDPVSKVPYLHQAFVSHVFVPIRYVLRQKPFDDFTFIGCFPEGYRIPTLLTKDENGKAKKRTTFDDEVKCMLVTKEICGPEGDNESNYFYVADSQCTNVGYLNLVQQPQSRKAKSAPAPKLNRERTSMMLSSEVSSQGSNSKTYLKRQISITEAAVKSAGEVEPLTPRSVSAGPKKMPKKKILPENADHVLAMKYPEWPKAAHEWTTRSRDHGWPGTRVEKKIVAFGCHVTPSAHPQSVDPENEWAFTFFQAENTLNKEAISSAQRQCFIVLNLLCMNILEKNMLSFQQLKTALYYTCEKTDQALWRNNRAACVNRMLDHLIKCVRIKHLPDYFIAENNTIGHVGKSDLVKLEMDLVAVRKNVMETLLAIPVQNAVVNIFPFFCDVPALFQPFVEDSKTFVKEKNIEQSIQAIVTTNENLCDAFYLDSGYEIYAQQFEEVGHYTTALVSHSIAGYEETIEYFIKIVQGDEQAKMHLDYLPQLLSQKNITLSQQVPLAEIWRPILMCRLLISKLAGGKTGAGLFDHLGCLVHIASKVFEDQKKDLLKRSDSAFKEAMKKEDGDVGLYVDYGAFLSRNGRHSECTQFLKKVIDAEVKAPTSMNFYGLLDTLVVDEFIKREIETRGGWEILSVSYALYLVCDSYLNMKKKAELMQSFKQLESVCSSTKDPSSMALLGYARMKVHMLKQATACFQRVLDVQPDNQLAKQYIGVCTKCMARDKSEESLTLDKKLTQLSLKEL